ncbi:hypothetical protein [Chitinophaga ginsengisoli]|uniref:Uncharacterized protein n=1 Tax=Chitinophaga ginsengisoli TaxID=363837 RepID=A0A2P8G9T6_9BACT|nr:hypothetical protein [Chitinophaga ginsengisoli]PSL30722.1 hypothetical protein CLV42_10583 [Chitinophaga ginsengisoli]
MIKELVFGNETFLFSYDEYHQEWCLEGADYFGGYETDLRIDKSVFPDGDVDWEEVRKFMLYLRNDPARVMDNIISAGVVLKSLFQEVYLRVEEREVRQEVYFEMNGITFRGYSQTSPGDFIYDYLMMPYYSGDRLMNVGTYMWRASFIRYSIYGVSREF